MLDVPRPANISVVFSDKFCDQLRDASARPATSRTRWSTCSAGRPTRRWAAASPSRPTGRRRRRSARHPHPHVPARRQRVAVRDAGCLWLTVRGRRRGRGAAARGWWERPRDLDVRPYGDDQGSWWVVSDQDSDLRGAPVRPDHVLGVGHASLSLARATARRPVDTVLDLGTGSGVQRCTPPGTPTGSPRPTCPNGDFPCLRDIPAQRAGRGAGPRRVVPAGRRPALRPGRVQSPVCRRTREGRLHLPRLRSERRRRERVGGAAVAGVPQRGGSANCWRLGAPQGRGLDRPGRVWLPRGGVDAWFVQRDVAETSLYVGTWLRDAGIDPRSAEGRAKAAAWLDWFEANDVLASASVSSAPPHLGATPRDRLRGPAARLRRPLGRRPRPGWIE